MHWHPHWVWFVTRTVVISFDMSLSLSEEDDQVVLLTKRFRSWVSEKKEVISLLISTIQKRRNITRGLESGSVSYVVKFFVGSSLCSIVFFFGGGVLLFLYPTNHFAIELRKKQGNGLKKNTESFLFKCSLPLDFMQLNDHTLGAQP